VSDGTRTRDRLDHNQELYLLSYAHRVPSGPAGPGRRTECSSGPLRVSGVSGAG
jgi:hypothetical protein